MFIVTKIFHTSARCDST